MSVDVPASAMLLGPSSRALSLVAGSGSKMEVSALKLHLRIGGLGTNPTLFQATAVERQAVSGRSSKQLVNLLGEDLVALR